MRPAGPEDADALARLRHAFRTELDPPAESEEAFLGRCTRWMAERLADSNRRWRCWVVEDDDAVGGHVWLALLEKVPNPVAEPEAHAYLTNMYVRPGDRGRGWGGRLLRTAVDWCRERRIGSIVLWPTDRSRPLYERFGFRATDRVYELPLGPAGEGAPERPSVHDSGARGDRHA